MNRRELLATLTAACVGAAATNAAARQPSRLERIFAKMHGEMCEQVRSLTRGSVKDLSGCDFWMMFPDIGISAVLPVARWLTSSEKERKTRALGRIVAGCPDFAIDAHILHTFNNIYIDGDPGEKVDMADLKALYDMFRTVYPAVKA